MSKNRLDFTANLGRHSLDVTAGYTASIAPGLIVPQYFDILQPGDTIKYKTHMFARFQDVNTAFLGEVDLHLDYFFVPLQMLYTAFGNIYAQTNDFVSSYYTSEDFTASGNFPYGSLFDYFSRADVYNDLKSTSSPCADPWVNELSLNFRLLDALDFNQYVALAYPISQHSEPLTIPFHCYQQNGTYWSLLAYQAIYQKYFRNEEFEKLDVSAYNVDQYSNTYYTLSQLRKMLTLRFCGRPNDYFTTVRFSPIATSINSILGGGVGDFRMDGGHVSGFANILNNVSDFLGSSSENGFLKNSGSFADYSNLMNISGTVAAQFDSDTNVNVYSAQNIRAVFALDKYMRVYGRAGKTYDDQILAHFGVKIPHDVKHDLTHLKHYRMVLQSDPVIASADTEVSALGSVGGQVVGQIDTNDESFRAPVHGVFMCVAYVQTHPRYFGTQSKLNSIMSRQQFPIPEFDKLGSQPMYGYEFDCPNPNAIVGVWQNRYAEFKQKYNRVSATFADYSGYLGAPENFFAPWVVSRNPLDITRLDDNFYNVDRTSLFESPFALNGVMAIKFNGQWSEDYVSSPHMIMQTDPILTEYCCFAKKISWMSPTGDVDL